RRVREIAEQFQEVRLSVLVENQEQLEQWRGSRLGVFIDINPGMNRTGLVQSHGEEIVRLVRAIATSGLEFRGLHYYDGQHRAPDERERTAAAHDGYHRLLEIVKEIDRIGVRVTEVITAGTPTLPSSLSFEGFRNAGFLHRVSPGTIVYCDATSLAQLPKEYGYRSAGLRAVSADPGVPTGVVVGHPELPPLSPSEEPLPVEVEGGAAGPTIGE